ncbi:MAG: elongation factor Ts [Bacteroidaceae bacterium]|nr:elongation factor Ts [Bacteroidaceae bacterium]
MAVTMADIAKLRKMTGAGMMDCKNALAEADGDFDKAMEVIRKKGQLVAAKRSDREASEGCVLAKVGEGFAAIIALKCETDFVAKNEDFIKLTDDILTAAVAAKCKTIEEVQALPLGDGTVQDAIVARTGITGEKMELDGYKTLEGENIYVYNHQKKNMLCTMVALSQANDEAGHEIAMQIAASAPLALTSEDLDPALVAREREVAADKAREEGKPENMIDRIADGRIQKYYKEVCLLQQGYVQNEKITVADYLKGFDKELTATGFQRFTLRAE